MPKLRMRSTGIQCLGLSDNSLYMNRKYYLQHKTLSQVPSNGKICGPPKLGFFLPENNDSSPKPKPKPIVQVRPTKILPVTKQDQIGIEYLSKDIKFKTSNECLLTNGSAYAFISKEYEQCHLIVTCKDHLSDIVFATVNNWETKNYWFSHIPANNPKIDFDKIRLVFGNRKSEDFAKTIAPAIDILHQMESTLKLSKTIVFRVPNPPREYIEKGLYLFEGDKVWMESPPMLSLYTLLIRLGAHHKIGNSWEKTIDEVSKLLITHPIDYKYYDQKICVGVMPGINKIINKGPTNLFGVDIKKNYPNVEDKNMLHNSFGVLAYSLNNVNMTQTTADRNKPPQEK